MLFWQLNGSRRRIQAMKKLWVRKIAVESRNVVRFHVLPGSVQPPWEMPWFPGAGINPVLFPGVITESTGSWVFFLLCVHTSVEQFATYFWLFQCHCQAYRCCTHTHTHMSSLQAGREAEQARLAWLALHQHFSLNSLCQNNSTKDIIRAQGCDEKQHSKSMRSSTASSLWVPRLMSLIAGQKWHL